MSPEEDLLHRLGGMIQSLETELRQKNETLAKLRMEAGIAQPVCVVLYQPPTPRPHLDGPLAADDALPVAANSDRAILH